MVGVEILHEDHKAPGIPGHVDMLVFGVFLDEPVVFLHVCGIEVLEIFTYLGRVVHIAGRDQSRRL